MICTTISFYTKQNENEFVRSNAVCLLPLGNLASNILKGGRIIKEVFFSSVQMSIQKITFFLQLVKVFSGFHTVHC